MFVCVSATWDEKMERKENTENSVNEEMRIKRGLGRIRKQGTQKFMNKIKIKQRLEIQKIDAPKYMYIERENGNQKNKIKYAIHVQIKRKREWETRYAQNIFVQIKRKWGLENNIQTEKETGIVDERK